MFDAKSIQRLFMKENTASEDLAVSIYLMDFENDGPKWSGKLKDLDKSKAIGCLNAENWMVVQIKRKENQTDKNGNRIPIYNSDIEITVV